MKDTDPYVMTGKECFGPVKIVKQFMKAKNINKFRPVKIERLSRSPNVLWLLLIYLHDLFVFLWASVLLYLIQMNTLV